MNILNPKNVIGTLGFFDDDSTYESEKSVITTFFRGVGDVINDAASLVTKDVAGVDKFPTSGTLNFKEAPAKQQQAQEEEKKTQKIVEQKRVFYSVLKEDQAKVEQDKINAQFEEDINDIAVNMSTGEINSLLHYQASYKNNRSTYQKAELRKKIIEERKKTEQQNASASMAQTQTGASALQTVFEGGSGSQGGGQSNLSFQAAG